MILWLVVGAAIAVAIMVASRRPDAPARADDGDDRDDGGSKLRVPKSPSPPASPTSESPPWWPQFERDFEAYTRELTRTH